MGFFISSRRRHTRFDCDWSSDVCSSDLRELRSILVPDIQPRIRVKNGLAVLYGDTLVNIIDASDPLRPRHVGTWNTDGLRSEERRVGKEGRGGWWEYAYNKANARRHVHT